MDLAGRSSQDVGYLVYRSPHLKTPWTSAIWKEVPQQTEPKNWGHYRSQMVICHCIQVLGMILEVLGEMIFHLRVHVVSHVHIYLDDKSPRIFCNPGKPSALLFKAIVAGFRGKIA